MSMEKKLPHDHGQKNEELLLREVPDAKTVKAVSDALRQLGDPSRLQIFWYLCHCEECVINLACMMNMSSPAVSHHLKLLKSAGLIVSRREGREMYYKAADTELAQSLHHIIETVGDITCPENSTPTR